MNAPSSSTVSQRSPLVTVLGWLIAVGGALFSIISFFSLLLILMGNDGARNTDLAGFLLVVVVPPVTAVAGVGLIMRWRWAWYYLVLGLAALIIVNAVTLARDPGPSVTTSVSPSGTKTTTYHSGAGHLLPMAVLSAGLLVVLLLPPFRREFASTRLQTQPPLPSVPSVDGNSSARGWRVGHQGRDCMYYEEKTGDSWQRIDISGEMLMGRAHHVIYFPPPETWAGFPEWARHRRDEIIARIKSEFREPDYEYASDVARPVPDSSAAFGSSHASGVERWTAQQWMAVIAFVAVLLGTAAFMGWKAKNGLDTGTITLPIPKASLQRPVLRVQEPSLFWFSFGVYAAASAGSLLVVIKMLLPARKA